MMNLLEFVSICGVITLTAAVVSQGLASLRRSRRQHSNPHVDLADEESSGRPAAGAWHEPRFGRRCAVSCPIEYVLKGTRYEGCLVDLSRRGWRAQGRHPVAKGTPMLVRILSSDPAQWITIDEAVVRWTDGLEFGVEVTRISPESAARLSDYLTLQFPLEVPARPYALSPFSYN
jgi:PilZ domain